MLANLGLTDAVKAKTNLGENLADAQALIAKGEVEIGIFTASRDSRAPGVAAGPVPAAVRPISTTTLPSLQPMPRPTPRSRC